jgi:predicted XRE-type DNA-binding protein
MRELQIQITNVIQTKAGRLLGVTQPRISDLKRGKIGLFTIDAPVNMLGRARVSTRSSSREGQQILTRNCRRRHPHE